MNQFETLGQQQRIVAMRAIEARFDSLETSLSKAWKKIREVETKKVRPIKLTDDPSTDQEFVRQTAHQALGIIIKKLPVEDVHILYTTALSMWDKQR